MMRGFEKFICRYPTVIFEKGQTVLLKDDIPKSVYYIESGFVKTYHIAENGNEHMISIDGKGIGLPIGYAIGLVGACTYFYEAYTTCKIRMIPRQDYVQHLYTDIDSLKQNHRQLTQLLLSAMSRINGLEQPHAGDKVVASLLYMADRVGERLRPQKKNLELHITQQEIADSLGLTRETAGIELKKLELKHLISHTRKSYVVSMERLKSYFESHQ